MTRSRYRIFDRGYPHFLTWSIVGWLPVFTRKDAVEIVLDSWKYLQQEREFKLFAYVILENHLHLIASAPGLDKAIKDSKSYTARQIIDLLAARGEQHLLRQLEHEKLAHRSQSDYQVWQEGSHPQQIESDEMMWQKIEYTHNNPVARGYVDDPVHWRYSSARNYTRQAGLIDVVTEW
jgi:REP element-mobilizing transposase RayT